MTAMEQSQPVAGRRSAGLLFIGLALVLLGGLILVDRLAIFDVRVSYWPFLAVALGVARLVETPRPGRAGGSRRAGIWLLLFGGWGFTSEYHLAGLRHETSWPLLTVAAGALMIWRWYEGPDARERPREC